MTDATATMTAVPATASRKNVRYKSPTVRGRLPVLILFLPPALLLFTVFVILPMGEAAWYSLYRGTATEPRRSSWACAISRCCSTMRPSRGR